LDANKHSNIVEHINWVLSELSVGVQKMLNRIGRTCAFFRKCGLQPSPITTGCFGGLSHPKQCSKPSEL